MLALQSDIVYLCSCFVFTIQCIYEISKLVCHGFIYFERPKVSGFYGWLLHIHLYWLNS